jgi:hypothetical protein
MNPLFPPNSFQKVGHKRATAPVLEFLREIDKAALQRRHAQDRILVAPAEEHYSALQK